MTEDQQDKVLHLIYEKWGRPAKVDQVRFRFYQGWDKGGTKRGRVFIYHLVPNPGWPDRVNIVSYFLKLHENTLRVYLGNCNENPDLVILL